MDTQEKLTAHPEGSVKELWTIAYPLMLSFLSGSLMMFIDRLILAKDSTEAMNAAAMAGMVCAIFQFGTIGIASIAEVFVGRYNGAKQFFKLGEPVWQMIWFSLMTSVLFIPLAIYGGPYVLSDYHFATLGQPYYKILLLFGSVFPCAAALSSFFIGMGKVRLVLFATVLGNILNVLLDILFVFGWDPYLLPLRTAGAALATGISQMVQCGLLFVVFLNHRHRNTFGTNQWAFKWKPFWDCLRIGVPSALGHMIEITAWAVMMQMMVVVSDAHVTAIAIGQSLYSLVSYGTEGLQKAVTAIAANFMGAKKWNLIGQLLGSSTRLLVILAAISSLPLLFYPEPLLYQFLSTEPAGPETENLYLYLRIVSALVWAYFIFDGFTWTIAGILTAAGDTKFVMIMNAISAWVFALIPLYLVVVVIESSPFFAWVTICFYGLMNAVCFYIRYTCQPWKKSEHF